MVWERRSEYLPLGQSEHPSKLVAPTAWLAFPGGQDLQTVDCSSSTYFPASHGLQEVAPTPEIVPTLQRPVQNSVTDPPMPYLPVGQSSVIMPDFHLPGGASWLISPPLKVCIVVHCLHLPLQFTVAPG